MNRKTNHVSRRAFSVSLFTLLAILVATAGFTGPSLSQSQQAPTLRIVSEDGNRLPTIIITGDDIRNLPPGENRIIREVENTAPSGARYNTTSKFSVQNTDSGAHVSLVKTGPGTIALPPANGATKAAHGTLTLSGVSGVVYEFRDLGPLDFDNVLVPRDESLSINFTQIKMKVQQDRPESAMRGWPFKRLLLVPAAGVAQATSTTGKVKTYTNPQGRYSCEGKFCQCSGTDDCVSLASSNACASAMNCDGAGNGVNCYCRAK